MRLTVSGRPTQPPPGANTIPPCSRHSSVSACSSMRKAGSPFWAKISEMVIPSRRAISESKSRKLRSSSRASAEPTVLFPAPGRPTRMRCGTEGSAADPGCDVRKVAIEVPLDFGEGIPAELLQHGVREHEGEHRFGDDAHRGHGGDVAPLGGGGRGLAGGDVHGTERAHEGADRLHRDFHDERLAGRHAALEAARVVRGALDVAGPGTALRRRDLVVDLRAVDARRLEAHADLHPFHRRDGHDRRADASVELAVPRDVRAEAHRQPVHDDLADAAEGVAGPFGCVDALDHLRLGVRVERAALRGVRYLVELRGHWIGAYRVHAAKMHEVAADGDTELREQAPRNRAGSDARGRLACRCALEDVARVLTIVLEDPGEIGVTRSDARDGAAAQRAIRIAFARRGVHDRLPVRPVAIADEHRDGTTERLAGAHTGEDLRRIALDLHAPPATITLLASRQVGVDVRREKRKASGHALEYTHEG